MGLGEEEATGVAPKWELANKGDHLNEGANGGSGLWGRGNGRRRVKPGKERTGHGSAGETLALLIRAAETSHPVLDATLATLLDLDGIGMKGLRQIRPGRKDGDSRECG